MTAPSVANVQAAIELIYPKVFEFQKKKELVDIEAALQAKRDKELGNKRKQIQSNGHRKKPNLASMPTLGDRFLVAAFVQWHSSHSARYAAPTDTK